MGQKGWRIRAEITKQKQKKRTTKEICSSPKHSYGGLIRNLLLFFWHDYYYVTVCRGISIQLPLKKGKEERGSTYITIYCVWSAGMFLSLAFILSLSFITLFFLFDNLPRKTKGSTIFVAWRRGKRERDLWGERYEASGTLYKGKCGIEKNKTNKYPALSYHVGTLLPFQHSPPATTARAFNTFTWGGL